LEKTFIRLFCFCFQEFELGRTTNKLADKQLQIAICVKQMITNKNILVNEQIGFRASPGFKGAGTTEPGQHRYE
jgi:hypothetical protein